VFEGASAQEAVSWAAPGVRPAVSINHSIIIQKNAVSPPAEINKRLSHSLKPLHEAAKEKVIKYQHTYTYANNHSTSC
jgi:hypothetical protein